MFPDIPKSKTRTAINPETGQTEIVENQKVNEWKEKNKILYPTKFKDTKEWKLSVREKRMMGQLNRKQWSPPYKERVKTTYYEFWADGYELTTHACERFFAVGGFISVPI